MLIANNLTELIGRTPLMRLSNLFPDPNVNILAKMELFNPSSIKDRPMHNIISNAIASGRIRGDTVIVEASSGNSGIALASLGAVLGFRTRIYMSEACSVERQQVMCAFGATVVLTPASEHTRGAKQRAEAFCRANADTSFFICQHGNVENGRAHYQSTGPELWEQTNGEIGAVVIGLGTCGTFEGVSTFLKEKDKSIKIIGIEPSSSPVFSGGQQGPHCINGIGPGMVTQNFQRAKANADEILLVEDETAFDFARLVARKEGFLIGPTSGATVWGASQIAQRPEMHGKAIVCFFYDSGERYLSVAGLFPADTIEREG